jgi:hypothetical protein
MMFRAVFWVIQPCKLIVDRRFRGAYCLHDHPWWWRQYTPLKRRSTIILHGSITQKTTLNIIPAAVRTWNLTWGKVDGFPDILKNVIDKNNILNVSRILYMDLTWLSAVHQPQEIIARRGKHQVGAKCQLSVLHEPIRKLRDTYVNVEENENEDRIQERKSLLWQHERHSSSLFVCVSIGPLTNGCARSLSGRCERTCTWSTWEIDYSWKCNCCLPKPYSACRPACISGLLLCSACRRYSWPFPDPVHETCITGTNSTPNLYYNFEWFFGKFLYWSVHFFFKIGFVLCMHYLLINV